MFNYNIVVRHKSGDLEGFSASSLSIDIAKIYAENKAIRKVRLLGLNLNDLHFLDLNEYSNLSDQQKAQMRKDWDMSTKGKGEL